jgi:hypothetical protein
MGNAIAGECCSDAFHSWMEAVSWQMGSFPGKFGSSLVPNLNNVSHKLNSEDFIKGFS